MYEANVNRIVEAEAALASLAPDAADAPGAAQLVQMDICTQHLRSSAPFDLFGGSYLPPSMGSNSRGAMTIHTPSGVAGLRINNGDLVLNGGRLISVGGTGQGGGIAGTAVPFINGTTAWIPAGAVMVIDSVIQRTTVIGGVAVKIGYIKATKPDSTFRRLYAVNAGAPVNAGKIGYCTLSGPGTAWYNSADGTPAAGESWGAKSGEWWLRKNRPGFTITGVADSTLKLVSFDQEQVDEVLGFTQEAIAKGATGTVELYFGVPGSEAISEYTIEAYNAYSDIAIDKWTGAAWRHGYWYLDTKEC